MIHNPLLLSVPGIRIAYIRKERGFKRNLWMGKEKQAQRDYESWIINK